MAFRTPLSLLKRITQKYPWSGIALEMFVDPIAKFGSGDISIKEIL